MKNYKLLSMVVLLIIIAAGNACKKNSAPSPQARIHLGTGNNALNANEPIYALTTDKAGNVYAGGMFTNARGKNYVAKWDGTKWSELGSGANALNANNDIRTLAADGNGNIYAGGYFTNSAGIYIAKWDGNTWTELTEGLTPYNLVGGAFTSLAIDAAGIVYATGNIFDSAGHVCVLKWDGARWSELGSGILSRTHALYLNALAIDQNGNVYTGGYCTDSVANPMYTMGLNYPDNPQYYYYVAKWNGTTWEELGTASNGIRSISPIAALATDVNNNVYACDRENVIPIWDGSSWTRQAAGVYASLRLLAIDPAGTMYSTYKYRKSMWENTYITKWNGSKWNDMDSLETNSINTIVTDQAGNLFAAGEFKESGTVGKYYVAKYSAK